MALFSKIDVHVGRQNVLESVIVKIGEAHVSAGVRGRTEQDTFLLKSS